jgi:hypothetical protein
MITDRDAEGLEILLHSTAHLLAHAVKELFPDAQVTIGPVVEDGFYYDFSYKRPFTPDDLAAIEKRMAEIAKRDIPVKRSVWERSEAVAFFKNQGEHYKAQIIESIPGTEAITLYQQDNFTDLCRGPHVPSTGKLKVFKLMKLAGAYWRGDSRNEMLQRIYGTAWAKKEELDAYLYRLEEAEKRPPQAWQATRSVPSAGRGARDGVLASQGLDHLAAGRAVPAARACRGRLPGGADPHDDGPQPVGAVGPLGELSREHVHHQFGEPGLRGQAHELPGAHPDLQPGHP